MLLLAGHDAEYSSYIMPVGLHASKYISAWWWASLVKNPISCTMQALQAGQCCIVNLGFTRGNMRTERWRLAASSSLEVKQHQPNPGEWQTL